MQLPGHRQRRSDHAEGEVPQHPDLVGRFDDVVPAIDEGAAHGVDVGERTRGIFDDVGMPEVKIGREPQGHDALQHGASLR
jgi:hypothetical protein